MVLAETSTGILPAPTPRIAELVAIWDALDDQFVLNRLKAYRPVGRQGYPLRAMWRAYVASFALNLANTNCLIRALEDDPQLRAACGFDPDALLPHRRTFNRFVRRMRYHVRLVERCFAKVTKELKTLLPDLGETIAIDASPVRSYSNPRKRRHGNPGTDPEAGWAVSHTTQTMDSDGLKWVFGYKLHMMGDANYGIPLASVVTTGNRNDSQEVATLMEKAKLLHRRWHFSPSVAIADKGYDSAAIHRLLWRDHHVVPIIPVRSRPGNDPRDLYDDIYNREGVPLCLGMVPMEYKGTDQQGRRVYQCRESGCDLKDSYLGGIRHCDTVFRFDPSSNLRLFGVVRRSSRRWKQLYRKRQSIERTFKSLKQSRRLEQHCHRGLRQVRLHITMAVMVYQATVLATLRTGKAANMRWQVREVA